MATTQTTQKVNWLKWAILLVVLLLVTLVGVKIYQKYKDKKSLEEANKLNVGTGGGVSAGTGGTGTQTTTLGNDEFPLKIGSKGNRVKSLQSVINRLAPQFKLKEDGDFGQTTYNALITGIGTKYYPVTTANFMEIFNKASGK